MIPSVCMPKILDAVRMTRSIAFRDPATRISGPVIHQEQLPAGVRLRKDAVYGLVNILRSVEERHADGYDWT